MTLNEINAIAVMDSKKPRKIQNNAIWKHFRTPVNDDVPFKRGSFFNHLLYEAGHFEIYTNALEIFTVNLTAWSKLRLPYWQRMFDILCAEYEPLWNYNRYDEDAAEDNHTANNGGTENNKVAGFDSGELVENYNTDTTVAEQETDKHSRNTHSYGNIGVMSTQDLVKQELEVCRISMYDIIIDDFKERFCIQVY